MPGRYYERTQGIERARREVEGELAAILLGAFTTLWGLIFPKVRDGRTDQIPKTIDEWGDEFDDDYGGGLVLGAGILAKSEVEWWSANGKDIEISGAEVARQFEADNVAAFGNKPADMIAANIKSGVQREIAKAATVNMTTDELNARLRRWMDAARAQVISVTDTNNLMSVVTKIGMERAGVGFWVWQTMEDDRVCEECEPLHGRVYSINDEMPPKHHNCILPGQEVSIPLLVGASQSIYRGKVIEIRTGKGRVLTVTPYHPIACNRGWISAQDLKIGDDLVCHDFPGSIDSSQIPDYDNGPAMIEDIFHALKMVSGMMSRIVPTAPEDFHGDGRRLNGNVEVIAPDWQLRNNLNIALDQLLRKEFFGFSNIELSDISSMSTFDFFLSGVFPATYSNMGSFRPGGPLADSGFSHHNNVGLGLAPNGDVVSDENAMNDRATDGKSFRQIKLEHTTFIEANDLFLRARRQAALIRISQFNALLDQYPAYGLIPYPELFSDLSNAFPGGVLLDNVIDLRLIEYSGHVYDLQSDFYGLYTCQGVFVKNCRCVVVPLKQWLRQHDQPFYSIAEGLAQR